MKVIHVFKQSIRQLPEYRNMIFLLYGIELILAFSLVIPLQNQFVKMIGYSLLSREILQGFEMNVFIEWAVHWSKGASTQLDFILLIGLIYLVLSIFLQGGILGTIIRDEEASFLNHFFGNAGHYFNRFFRLFIFMIPLVFMIIMINASLGALLKWIAGDSEALRFLSNVFRLILTLILFLFVKMVFDYAKIQTVFRERMRMLKTIYEALAFVWRNLGKTLFLFYLIGFLGLAILLVQMGVSKMIHPTTVGIILLFIWLQIYILSRMAIRVLLFVSQTKLHYHFVEPDYENIL